MLNNELAKLAFSENTASKSGKTMGSYLSATQKVHDKIRDLKEQKRQIQNRSNVARGEQPIPSKLPWKNTYAVNKTHPEYKNMSKETHERAIKKAIERGENIPTAVKKEYSHLFKKKK